MSAAPVSPRAPHLAGQTRKAARLASAARSAAQVRAYQTDPDVIALRIERLRGWVDRLIWTGLILGLLFTMANVQHFAAGDSESKSTQWVIAWLLDPMVSLVLIGVLMGEQVIGRYRIKAGPWVRRTKWTALVATYAMNTWSAWAALDPAKILLHSVPPVMVFCAAEAVTTLRHQITEAVSVAYRAAADRAAALQAAEAPSVVPGVVPALAEATRTESRTGDPQEAGDSAPAPRTADPHSADDSASASRTDGDPHGERTRTRNPHGPGDPARETRTADPHGPAEDVDRDALVAELAEQMRADRDSGSKWRPDYPGLRQRTGRGQRWCEYVVRDARNRYAALADDGPHGADSSAPALRTDTGPHGEQTRTHTPHGADGPAPAPRMADPHDGQARTGEDPHDDPHADRAGESAGSVDERELVSVGGDR